ncbi:MutS protein 1 [Friedmanniomyces endolithicus]|uniref:MutS protein 1 n=1 Tax=Friedmanniomyces endolithicus TaxID=329885 RepID=A0AAN6KCT0_9PEZI|nr:MutS protein 1 [Friedmanniomyces endolithicus]KAK0975782.1 MutS protein 1 [Friedmanniomyces endolithicus]KAK1023024.1 MutS protein 1 [Friedmanniomyces endolithicus]
MNVLKGAYKVIVPVSDCWANSPLSTRTAWVTSPPCAASGRVWQRGVKTRTVVKASSLPQGVLPPLPPDESDKAPTKAYPTMLQQHLNNVRKFKDCVVLTRVGDFYEMYFDQVEQYAPLVNLKKAKKATVLGDVAMAGFQYTQLDRYLKIERSTKAGAPMYERKVTRVITAGTLIDESFMDPYENNYLLAVHVEGALPVTSGTDARSEAYERYKRTTKVGLSWVDLSSGDFFTQSSDLATLPSLVARISPREVIFAASTESAGHAQLQKMLGDGGYSIHFHSPALPANSVRDWTPMLEQAVNEKDIEAFTNMEIAARGLVLAYIKDKLRDTMIRLQPPVRKSDEEYMSIDKQSLRGLEIRNTLRDGTFQGSLLHAVRHTVTKSGARLLSQRLVSPSMSLSVINNRLDLVQEMLEQDALREDVVALLRRTADTLRLVQRFAIGKGSPDDLLDLARTIDVMGRMTETLHEHIIANQDGEILSHRMELGFLWDIIGRLDLHGPAKVAKDIQEAIDEEGLDRQHVAEAEGQEEAEEMAGEVESADAAGEVGPKLARRASRAKSAGASVDSRADDIWIMRKSASTTLERAHGDLRKLMGLKSDLEQDLRKQLEAQSLTLKWSAQLGHFCHVRSRDAQRTLAKVEGARSIATSKSTQTFYLSDWTHLGVRVDDSKFRIRTEEERVFSKLRAQVIENLMKLRRNAAVLDELDVACSSATVAKERNLIRPILNESTSHNIPMTAPSATTRKPTPAAIITGGLLGCAASAALLAGVGIWHEYNGTESAILAARTAELCMDCVADDVTTSLKAGTYSTDEALDVLRRTTLSYASTVPGGVAYVERLFREVSLLRQSRGGDVDKVLRSVHGKLNRAALNGATPDAMRTIVISQLARLSTVAGASVQDIMDRNPALKPLQGSPTPKVPTLNVNLTLKSKIANG